MAKPKPYTEPCVQKHLKEHIDHFNEIADMVEKAGETSNHREIATMLKRLQYLERQIATGNLVWKEGNHD